MKKIFVIIPAYNEARSIGSVVRDVKKLGNFIDCVVVDDGSNDGTARVAGIAGARVLKIRQNRGNARAVLVGLQEAMRKRADCVVLMDADGQHNPSYIPGLIRQLGHGVDMVIASRYIRDTKRSTSLLRQTGTFAIARMIQVVYGKVITDPTSGYRALNKRVVRLFAQSYPVVFPEPESVMLLLDKAYTISEVSSQMRKRYYGKSSISLINAMQLMGYIMKKLITRAHTINSG